MTVNIYIQKNKGARLHYLHLYVNRRGFGKARVSLPLRVKDQDYDRKKQQVKNSHPSAPQINRVLGQMKLIASNTYWEFLGEKMREPTNKELQDAINLKLGRKVKDMPKEDKMDLFKYVEEELIPRKHNVTQKRKNSYKTVLRHLKAFEKAKNYPVDFHTINMKFYHKFLSYLSGLGLEQSYIHEHLLKTLIFFLNQATDEGHNTNMEYKNRRFKVIAAKEGQGIALTKEELVILKGLDLSDCPYLQRVRDIFVMGCYLGLRYGDYKNIRKDCLQHRNGKQFLKVFTQKTKEHVIIPLHPYAQLVLEKYDYQLPLITNQKMNKYLKELGEYALFNEKITKVTSKGNVQKYKYELMTTHTARRTFATNAYKDGIPMLEIMAITAHKSEITFRKYVRASKTEMADRTAKRSFFN